MQQSDAIGFVLARPARMLGIEPFFAELIAGLEEGLSIEGRPLLLLIVADHKAEVAAYRRWATGSMVEAVIVVNLFTDDHRLNILAELGLPAIAIGGPPSGLPVSNVWVDDAQSIRDAIGFLALLGHRHLARVSGPVELQHTRERTMTFALECSRLDLVGTIVVGDYSEEAGSRCTRTLLGRAGPPSAVIYDNDVMALAGLGVASELGLAVPDDLSIVAWDDSPLCRLSNPPLSAMTLDVHAMGIQAAGAVLNTLAGGPVKSYRIPQPRLSARASTARPQASAGQPRA